MKNDLPSLKTRRWVMSRKARVVVAVQNGLITEQEAMSMYGLSQEEFNSWKTLTQKFGVRGLRATRAQDYRNQLLSFHNHSSVS